MNYTWHTFNNFGYITLDVPSNILDRLNAIYTDIKNGKAVYEPNNLALAGQITEEYSLDSLIPNFEDYFNEAAMAYVERFNVPLNPLEVSHDPDEKYDIKLKRLWLNIQKKHEYNPPHTHSGVMSFALWLKIPYNIDIESSLKNTYNSNLHLNGKFTFVYSNTIGGISTVEVDKSEYREGVIAIFPSKLMHAVYPFYTSDEDRVSISGNFYYIKKGSK